MGSGCKFVKVISTLLVAIAVFGVMALPAWADGERESSSRGNTNPLKYDFTLYTNPLTWQYTA